MKTVTVSGVTLRNVVIGGHVCTYWYEVRTDAAMWHRFDIRELAAKRHRTPPKLFTKDDMDLVFRGVRTIESVQERDLHRVAEWCAQ